MFSSSADMPPCRWGLWLLVSGFSLLQGVLLMLQGVFLMLHVQWMLVLENSAVLQTHLNLIQLAKDFRALANLQAPASSLGRWILRLRSTHRFADLLENLPTASL